MKRYPPLEKPQRRLPWKLISLILIVGLTAGSYWGLKRWYTHPRNLAEAVVIDFVRGTSLDKLSLTLQKEKILSSRWAFKVGVRLFADYASFKAGTYLIETGYSYASIASMLTDGRIHEPIILTLTIPEGFSKEKIVARLVAREVGTKEDYAALWQNKELMNSLGLPGWEGFLFPSTYSFRKIPSPEEMVRILVKTFFDKLPQGYEVALKERGMSLYEGVNFASLIEKETAHVDEMPLVSEVIWRRLKRGWPLGIDAAVIYGIEEYDGDIKWKDLRNAQNPFNTRIHKGLPPTPICSPSTQALLAVLNPSDEGYYYYVLDVDNEGRHYFSKTLAEHNMYVKKLVQASKRAKAGKER
jgi:UPF0755 protein